MKEVMPFELLQEIVGQSPISLFGEMYRPIVFLVNATQHYVFCLVPFGEEPHDFFEEIGEAYDAYLDGKPTSYKFFRDKHSEDLKTQVVEWYKSIAT
jgi:hypothetical protein